MMYRKIIIYLEGGRRGIKRQSARNGIDLSGPSTRSSTRSVIVYMPGFRFLY